MAATSPPPTERFDDRDRKFYAVGDAPPSPEYDNSDSSVSGSEDEYAHTTDVVLGEITGEVNLSEYMIELERKFQAELLGTGLPPVTRAEEGAER